MTIKKPPAKATGRDSRGRQKGDFVEVGKANAKIKPLSGTESETARQLVATATHEITLRVQRKIQLTTKHQFEFRGRVFDIGHIQDTDELQAEWVCTVTELRA